MSICGLYEIDTIVVGMPFLLNGDKSERAKKTEKFIHKLKCKYNKIKIDWIDERLTTVAAHKAMNYLDINKHKKKNIVDTISAVYILDRCGYAACEAVAVGTAI